MSLIARLAGVTALTLTIVSPASAQIWHTPPSCWSAARLTHADWSEQPGERLRVHRSREAPDGGTWVTSPNGGYRFRKIDPDFVAPPPWTTRIVIEAERSELTIVELGNHGNAPAHAAWLNEKLVFVRVWWGRVLGADLIVDAEKGDVVWKETARGGDAAFEQSRNQPCPGR
jgi:hypothetical protein